MWQSHYSDVSMILTICKRHVSSAATKSYPAVRYYILTIITYQTLHLEDHARHPTRKEATLNTMHERYFAIGFDLAGVFNVLLAFSSPAEGTCSFGRQRT